MNISIRNISLSFFFTLMIVASARISIPMEPVPLTMQTAVIFIAALLLPMGYSFFSVILYLVLGIIGLPVFSGGRSGIEVFQGPTAGFLVGFIIITALISYLSRNDRYITQGVSNLQLTFKVIWPCVIATILLQLMGVLWGKIYTGSSWPQMLEQWLYPFYINMIFKILVTMLLVVPLWKYFRKD